MKTIAIPVLLVLAGCTSVGSMNMNHSETVLPDIDSMWDYSDPATSEQRFRELAESHDAAGHHAYRAEVMTQVARAQGLQRQFDAAHATLDGVQREASETTPLLKTRYLLERGRVFNSSGRPAQAVPLFVEAWECAVAHGLDSYAVDAAHMLAIAAPAEHQIAWAYKGIEHAEKSNDERARKWLGTLYNNLGWTLHDAGKYEEALSIFQKALAWREGQGSQPESRIAKWAVARTYRSLERYEEALEMQRALKAELEAAGEPDGYVDEELGENLLALGRADEARPHFAEAHRLLSQDAWLANAEPDRVARLQRLGERAAR